MITLKQYAAKRQQRLKKLLRPQGYDGIIVHDPNDVWYLTGFTGGDSVLLLYSGKKVLLTDSRYVEQVHEECPGMPIFLRKDSITDAAGEVLARWLQTGQKQQKSKPAFALDKNAVTIDLYKRYQKTLRQAGGSLVQDDGLIKQLRKIKDEFEAKQIRKAVRIAEDSLTDILSEIKPGVTENELTGRLLYEMNRRGGGPMGFDPIVAFGPHAAHPHARPGDRKLQKNQTLLFDWGAMVNGYRSDLTRCFAHGKIRPVFADVYESVLKAQLAAINRIKAGEVLSEVDLTCRKTLAAALKEKKRDYKIYAHGSGHGIGLNIHELPFLSPTNKQVLEEGMIITIEPGVYVPGQFGVRIEDDVLVTSRGAKVLSRIRKDLDFVLLV